MFFRLACTSYTYYTHQDEPGGLTDPDQHISEPETLWEGELDETPDNKFFEELEIDMPPDDCGGCACEGSSEFSYEVSVWRENDWKFVTFV
jgi:hypothetical protein